MTREPRLDARQAARLAEVVHRRWLATVGSSVGLAGAVAGAAAWNPLLGGTIAAATSAWLSRRARGRTIAIARHPARSLAGAMPATPATGRVVVLSVELEPQQPLELGTTRGAAERAAPALRHLRGCSPPIATGLDRFVVGVRTDDAPGRVADRLLEAVTRPLALDGEPVAVDATAGVAVADGIEDADELVAEADAALRHARRTGRRWSVSSPEAAADARRPAVRIDELAAAIEAGEIVPHYQPKASLRTGSVLGVEALARWYDPVRSWIPPVDFIAVAEHSRLIRPLTTAILDSTLRSMRAWNERGLAVDVAVNLSARLLADDQIVQQVASSLRHHDVDPHALELEITETAIIGDPEQARRILERLYRLGVRLSIDDFGVGQTSLSYLADFPVSEVKIDRLFVNRVTADRDAQAIVASTAALGRELGLTVVAEGVEHRSQWDLLAQLGCAAGQGYLLSPPMVAGALPGWLEAHDPSAFAAPQPDRSRPPSTNLTRSHR